jgi:hypothetical protein
MAWKRKEGKRVGKATIIFKKAILVCNKLPVGVSETTRVGTAAAVRGATGAAATELGAFGGGGGAGEALILNSRSLNMC